ncbi:MAG: hypothetical protein Q4P71_08290 [Actinomycetaceae bacterium]|nr:hypothetical protein [Actinomycetaceae bacterium]
MAIYSLVIIPIIIFLVFLLVGSVLVYWWKRGQVGPIALLLCWLLLAYETVGLLVNLIAAPVLISAPTVLVTRKYTEYSFDGVSVPVVAAGGKKFLVALPFLVYVVAAVILIVALIRVLLAYQRHTFFDRSFLRQVTFLGRTLFFGGLATLITRFAVEIIAETITQHSPLIHAQLTDGGRVIGWNGEWWSYGDGVVWIVPGIIIMMLPALIQKGVELQREVDYLV